MQADLDIRAKSRAVWRFYRDGFRSMTWGRALWVLIIFKLVVMFCILRPFFFKDYLKEATKGGDKSSYVSSQLIGRASPATNKLNANH